MILVCGIHGVERESFFSDLAEKTGLPVISAKSLIKNGCPTFYDKKSIIDYKDNQRALLEELKKLHIQKHNFILDGHLCLLDKNNRIHRIDMNFIQQMLIDSMILLVDSPTSIKKNLENHDRLEWSNNFIESFQNGEIKYAKEISQKLKIDLQILTSHPSEPQKFGVSLLLPIKPQFVERILAGEKRFEYRTRLCNRNIDKIYLYSTYPVKKVVGECKVAAKYQAEKKELWELTEQYSGITLQQYNEYFLTKNMAAAYELKEVKHYEHPLGLEYFGVHFVPQTYAYVKTYN